MTAPLASQRELNRATLARQLLLERSNLDPIAAIEHLVELQAQTPQTWYTGLWSRLGDFDPVAFGALLESRDVVRIAAMRSTIHLVSARDALFLRPIVQPATDRAHLGTQLQENWPDHDVQALGQVARIKLALVQTPPRGVWARVA